jgi:hypothetical protein
MTSFNEWIDTKIKDGEVDFIEYNEFSNVEKNRKGAFGVIESADWKSYGIKIALKTLIGYSSVDENSMNEFVKEVIIILTLYTVFIKLIYLIIT